MLTARDIKEPGFYWCWSSDRAAPAVVEVVDSPIHGFAVRLLGRQDQPALIHSAGQFLGPISPWPCSPVPGGTRVPEELADVALRGL